MRPLKLLVSVINEKEASIASEADIIDIKNPKEGSLGANFPLTIFKIRKLFPNREISATIGDMPDMPGTASLAGTSVAQLGVDYVKVGLCFDGKGEVRYFLEKFCENIRFFNPKIKIVAAAYADYKFINSINPFSLISIGKKVGIDGIMIDVKNKKNGNLFTLLSEKEIKKFVDLAHDNGFFVALAGSLSIEDLPKVFHMGADIFGVRGSICENDRTSSLSPEKVKKLIEMKRNLTSLKVL
jgi:uncharacterized protein (UPF0264 family)